MTFLDWQVVTPAAGDVVTVEEFIDHARLNGLTVDRQPELIGRELAAATARAERYCRRSLLTQTLKALYAPDGKDCRCTLLLALPRGNVQSVSAINSGGAVVDPAGYHLSGWNTIVLESPLGQAAEVLYVSGYGDNATDVPAPIREGILEYAATLYDDRMGGRESKYVATAGQTIPSGVIDLWRPYQIEVSG